jgi:hypothetical protein
MFIQRTITCALLLLLLAACDNKQEEPPTPAPTLQQPTTTAAKPKQTSATPTTSSEATSQQNSFHEGRFSIDVPGKQAKPATNRTDTKLTTNHMWSDTSAAYSVMVNESLIESPDAIVDDGMLAFVEMRMLKKAKKIIEQRKFEAFGREGRYALYMSEKGKREHQAVFAADDFTIINLLIMERQPISSDIALEIITSVKQEKAPAPRPKAQPKKLTREDIQKILTQETARGEVSKEDLANIPRSTKPGEPSVANSCNIRNRQCYETAHSEVGKGYYSNEKQCGGSFDTGPCPAQDRMGFCLLNEQQLISMYTASGQTLEDRKKLCEVSYKGKWLGTPKERPWPRNAK